MKDAYAFRSSKQRNHRGIAYLVGRPEVWLKCTFTRESSSDELRTFEPESSIQLTSRGMESPLQGKPMQFCYTVY